MKLKNHIITLPRTALLLAVSLAFTVISQGAFVSYYVGIDSLVNVASGTYAGLPNLNNGKLTFLYAHPSATPATNHYHSKGLMRYTGLNLGAATATEASPHNHLPEGTRRLQLTIASSGGIYDGKRVVAPDAADSFSLLTIEDTGKLSGFAAGTSEAFMFNSSGGRWNGALTGADVHLELVSLTSGLNVGDSSTLNLFSVPGDDLHLEDSFSFTPVFWTDASAAPGDYTAVFKLTDESNTFGDSGNFEFRMTVIPEPSSALLGAFGALALLRRKR